jgi:HNH endonuclease
MIDSKINKKELSSLYNGCDIADIWQASLNLKVIFHHNLGKITPNHFRSIHNGKPCPFCAKRMVHGQSIHSTQSKQEAIDRDYQYMDEQRNTTINRIGNTYFHPHYVTLDHKLNKARFPEKMFDYDNLQAVCWKCNSIKSDNNAFELLHDLKYIQELSISAFDRYPIL